jgi:hypothetical protein
MSEILTLLKMSLKLIINNFVLQLNKIIEYELIRI